MQRKKNSSLVFLLLGIGIFVSATKSMPLLAALPKSLSAIQVASRLQATYTKTADFSASFQQSYKQKIFGRTSESKGTVKFKKPGNMRWDYVSPSPKSFIISGNSLWVYQPEDRQVMVDKCFKQDGLSASIAFLWGQGKLAQEFTLSFYQGELGNKNHYRLLLIPKKKNTVFKSIVMGIDKKTYQIKESIVIDLQDNTNAFQFTEIKLNQKLPTSLFAFVPPADVATVPVPGSCHKP